MPVQSSQDLDARFAVFLNPIRDLTKNWEVDIAKYLEEYLIELSEIQITFDGGETTMNFAEAAMLIQGSATVYSKKVEFLWQMVLQMLDLLSSKRSLESRSDTSKSGEGVRQKHAESFSEFEKVDELYDGKTINMKEDEDVEDNEMSSTFKFLPEMPLHLVEKESEKSLMKIVLYLKNMETFGNKDDFRINRSYLTTSGLLYLDLPPEILKKTRARNDIDPSADDSIAGFNFNDGEDLAQPFLIETQKIGFENNIATVIDEIENCEGDNFDTLELANDFPNSPDTSSNNVLQIEEIENACPPVEVLTEKIETMNQVKYGLRSQKGLKETINKIKFTEPLKAMDPHVETPAKRPIRAGRLRKPLPCMCHREFIKEKRKSRKLKPGENHKEISTTVLPTVENFITKDLANLISNNNNNNIKGKPIDPRMLEELASEDLKRVDHFKKKRIKEIQNAGNEKKLTNEEIEERLLEEKQQLHKIADRMADEINDDHIADIDIDNFGGDDDFAMPEPHDNGAFGEFYQFQNNGDGVGSRNFNDSALYEPGSDYEALVQKWVSDYVTSAQEHVSSSELTNRVNKWRRIITPKLQEEEDRKAFDIHEYGSKILNHFPEEISSEYILFDKLAHNEDSKEVSRIFLSCLMLANTYNIELNQTRVGDLEMDCLQLKMISNVRHHKEMEEYSSPVKKTKDKPDKRKKHIAASSDEEQAMNLSSTLTEHERSSIVTKKTKSSKIKKLKLSENYPNR